MTDCEEYCENQFYDGEAQGRDDMLAELAIAVGLMGERDDPPSVEEFIERLQGRYQALLDAGVELGREQAFREVERAFGEWPRRFLQGGHA